MVFSQFSFVLLLCFLLISLFCYQLVVAVREYLLLQYCCCHWWCSVFCCSRFEIYVNLNPDDTLCSPHFLIYFLLWSPALFPWPVVIFCLAQEYLVFSLLLFAYECMNVCVCFCHLFLIFSLSLDIIPYSVLRKLELVFKGF